MYKALKTLFIGCYFCGATTLSSAQQITQKDNAQLKIYQDSLLHLSKAVFSTGQNQDRFAKNADFIKTLVRALKIPGAYHFGFDSLKSISHIESPDKAFKIFSWFVPTDEGTYRFFGTIQMHTADGNLKLFPLIDNTEHFSDVNAITDNRNWFGCRYYEIIPIGQAKSGVYALLGWKGNNKKTSKKVIEILSFEKGVPVFGKPVFEGGKDPAQKNRIVFEYNKLNSMTLKMDKSAGMIVLDHLAPFNPQMIGNYEFYASDLSFDGYKPVNGKLKLMENIVLKNNPSGNDDFYVDPKRKDIPVSKKF